MKPSFYFFNGSFAYLGKSTDTEFHSHHALQITLSCGKPFIIGTELEEKEHMAAVVNSDTMHRLDSKDGWQIIILMDPDHRNSLSLNERGNFEILEVDYELVKSMVPEMADLMMNSGSCTKVREKMNLILEKITGDKIALVEKDERILKIENYVELLEEKKVSIKTLTDLVNLSESRLSHLFSEETGIPVRKYILWRRLVSSFAKIVDGNSLTEAAHYSGFSDSAHFSRTFKKMFGVSPFGYVKKFKDSSFVQLQNC